MKTLPIAALAAATTLGAAITAAAEGAVRVADLADYSLEQLANLKVTSVSRREERLVEAPASIFVITAEDIRRSGATSVGEALRLAPNLTVIRGDASQYIASARGGLAGTANKMLVLVDGRTIYSPLFSGVFWDAQDLVLEDIDRIEVISGPGSTLWGTNAVNGVINILTKTAAQTRGTLAVAYGGTDERGATVRVGAPFANGGAYRVYAKYAERNSLALPTGPSAHDASERVQSGFRADWAGGAANTTVQGDAYRANVDNLGGPRDLSGANLLGRWRSVLDSGSEILLQAYYDHTERTHQGSFEEKLDTLDVDFVHTLRALGHHEVNWGAGYRASRDRTAVTPVLALVPQDRTLPIATAFAQDELAVTPAFHLTAGLRAEHNVYTGLEWLPNLRFSWDLTPDHLAWGALTRTVRSPSRIDRDLVVPGSPPFVIVNNDTFQSEVADVAELGYRARLLPGASVSITAFHHRLRNLRTLEPGDGALEVSNGAHGRISGVEGWADWTVTPEWRLVGGFIAMNEETTLDPGHVNLTEPPLGNNPKRTASLRSLWNVTPDWEFDLAWRYQGRLESPAVPSYTVADARLGWRISRRLDASLLVANALDRRHVEFSGAAAELRRSALVRLTWTP
ncbi:MAG TPA: TonB-dependent receptor [Usitatibacter sp.]|jgi:iron complex outermembrane receptor protein|nr:TonB-dependent receptor [Usitatibacter sp.]